MEMCRVIYVEDKPEDCFEDKLIEEFNEINSDIKLSIEIAPTKEEALEKLKTGYYSILIIDLMLVKNGDLIESLIWFKENVKSITYLPVIFYSGYLHKISEKEFHQLLQPDFVPIEVVSKDEGIDILAKKIDKFLQNKIIPILFEINQNIRNIESKFLWENFHYMEYSNKTLEELDSYKEQLISRIGITLIADKLWSEKIDANQTIMVPPLSRTMKFWNKNVKKKSQDHLIVLSGEILKLKEDYLIVVSSTCDLIDKKIPNILCCKLKDMNMLLNIDLKKEISSTKWDKVKKISNFSNPRYFYLPCISEHKINEMLVDLNDVVQINKSEFSELVRKEPKTVIATLLPPFSDRLLTHFGNYFRIGTPQIFQIQELKDYEKYRKNNRRN